MSGLILATAVDWGALAKTALAALVAGTGITLAFPLAIFGTAQAADLRRDCLLYTSPSPRDRS